MITPKFTISQDEDYIILHINVPYSNIQNTEVFADYKEICFSSSPYHLRLFLPFDIIGVEQMPPSAIGSDVRNSAEYNSENCDYVIKMVKKIKGQYFTGLDVPTSLLKQKKIHIDDIDGDSNISSDTTSSNEECNTQTSPSKPEVWFPYGFARSKKLAFTAPQEEINLSIDIQEPDVKNFPARRKERMDAELEHFSYEHYLYDFHCLEEIKNVEKFSTGFLQSATLTKGENRQLLRLPKIKHEIDATMEHEVYMGLIDLLLSYCYNHRINMGEECCEASWNYAKLTSTLSWLDVFQTEEEVVSAFVRRSMVYPLYRNWNLSNLIVIDTINLLKCGKVQILKCLLEMQSTFEKCPERYILSQLYLTPYCCWVKDLKDEKFTNLATKIEKITLQKKDMHLDLVWWENVCQCRKPGCKSLTQAPDSDDGGDSDQSDSDSTSSSDDDQSDSESSSAESDSDQSDTTSSSTESDSDSTSSSAENECNPFKIISIAAVRDGKIIPVELGSNQSDTTSKSTESDSDYKSSSAERNSNQSGINAITTVKEPTQSDKSIAGKRGSNQSDGKISSDCENSSPKSNPDKPRDKSILDLEKLSLI